MDGNALFSFFQSINYLSLNKFCLFLTVAVSNKVSDSNKVIALESKLHHQALQTLLHLLRSCRMK